MLKQISMVILVGNFILVSVLSDALLLCDLQIYMMVSIKQISVILFHNQP